MWYISTMVARSPSRASVARDLLRVMLRRAPFSAPSTSLWCSSRASCSVLSAQKTRAFAIFQRAMAIARRFCLSTAVLNSLDTIATVMVELKFWMDRSAKSASTRCACRFVRLLESLSDTLCQDGFASTAGSSSRWLAEVLDLRRCSVRSSCCFVLLTSTSSWYRSLWSFSPISLGKVVAQRAPLLALAALVVLLQLLQLRLDIVEPIWASPLMVTSSSSPLANCTQLRGRERDGVVFMPSVLSLHARMGFGCGRFCSLLGGASVGTGVTIMVGASSGAKTTLLSASSSLRAEIGLELPS
mmetsp:Transcript_121738/g.355720  ORF Transcript_121738/g.355720 Transcript_121738/m.355720 type:complete len:300 (-) Transcript_121738:2124-3023(-)